MISTFRHALRSLMKSPGFTTVAILTLALGIGISASSFSTTNAFFLSSLPYPESDQLVRIFRTTSQTQTANFTPAAVLGLQDSITSMTDVTAYYYDLCSLSEPGQPPEQVGGISASANILTSLRVQPVLGRGFAPDDCEPGKGLGIIITDRMWKRRFAGSPDIIGRTVRINGETLSVIGVLPASFHAPLVWGGAEYLRPWIIYPGYRNKWDASWVDCFARLKPGVNLRQAQSELSTISARFAREYPKDWSIDGIHCTGFATSNMGGVNIPLFALMIGLSTAVLLVACANLASLQLARSFGRTREFAIRSSLGAGRFQLMAPLLAESMILALAGGGLGLIFTSWTNHYVGSQLNISGDRGFDIPIDAKVLVYALVVALLTGLAFGIVPAWLASRVPASDALKEGARGSTGGPSHNRIRFGLIIAEIALSLVLVATAGSFAVACRNLLDRDLGWKPDQIFQTSINRPYNRYSDDPKRREFDRALLEKLQALPGVEKVTLCSALPLFGFFNAPKVLAEGFPEPVRGQEPIAECASVSPDYFSLLGVPLKDGRLFPALLSNDGPEYVIVSDSFARRFWPGQSAVGKRIRVGDESAWSEVIGVVGNVSMAAALGPTASPHQIYRPLSRHPNNYMTIAVRSSMPAESLTNTIRKVVFELDQDLPLLQPSTIRDFVKFALQNLDVLVVNIAGYAVMALLISGIGIYGVIAHLTAQRTRDIGVRMALGALQGDILRMVLVQGARLLVFGILAGVILTTGVLHVLQSSLVSMALPNLWLQVVTVILISLTTLIACYLPAYRASHIDPVIALRAD